MVSALSQSEVVGVRPNPRYNRRYLSLVHLRLRLKITIAIQPVPHATGEAGAGTANNKTLIPVTSLPASQYASTSTTQPQLISLHLALERLRILSRRSLSTSNGNGQANATASPSSNGHGINGARRGPRVMVLGPPSSGKTSVVKNLVNMAVGSGMGWNVGVAGLDPASVS